MKLVVNQETCIGCGNCPSIAPEVFDFNEEGLADAIIDIVPEDLEDIAKEAINSCPVDAIKEVE